MSAGVRVVVDLRLRDDWPGDEAFDEWVRNVVAHALGRLGAVERAEVVTWGRDGLEPEPEPVIERP